jgi:putative hydrolase of the HAD superfamily
MTTRRAIIWDYDGTLGYREGGMWTATTLQVIREEDPGAEVAAEDVRARLQGIFPWERPDEPHPHLSTPEAWWEAQVSLLASVLRGMGYPRARARRMGERIREVYLTPASWRLFPDTLSTLDALRARGWRHYVLSNHLPELRGLVARLGLAERLSGLVNSAEIGYEKPHPEAFRCALEMVGVVDVLWMVGDNPVADVAGAEAAGIPAILVRTAHEGVRYRAADLTGVPAIVEASTSAPG